MQRAIDFCHDRVGGNLKKIISGFLALVGILGLSGCSLDPNYVSLDDAKKGIRTLFYEATQACNNSARACSFFFQENVHPDMYDFDDPKIMDLVAQIPAGYLSSGAPELDTVQETPDWLFPIQPACDPLSISSTEPPRGKTFIVTLDGRDVHVTHLDGKFYFYQSLSMFSC